MIVFLMSMKSINAIACVLILCGTSAFGQGFPSRPIRIETGSVGSNGDVISRLVGPTLASGLGQPVLVENLGGASGGIATQDGVTAKACLAGRQTGTQYLGWPSVISVLDSRSSREWHMQDGSGMIMWK